MCDFVSWEDYFDSVIKIIEAGGPMAETVKSRVEEDFKESVRFLKIMDKWGKGESRTILFKKYLPLTSVT